RHFNINYWIRTRRNWALLVVGRMKLREAPVIWFVESGFQVVRFVEHSRMTLPVWGRDWTVALRPDWSRATLVICGGAGISAMSSWSSHAVSSPPGVLR